MTYVGYGQTQYVTVQISMYSSHCGIIKFVVMQMIHCTEIAIGSTQCHSTSDQHFFIEHRALLVHGG